MSDTPTRHKPAWGIDYAIVFATAGSDDSGTGPEAQIRRLEAFDQVSFPELRLQNVIRFELEMASLTGQGIPHPEVFAISEILKSWA
ncbi:hypothetical protein TWF225_008164 [Orbilia oligospora]|nr:hypothetical protein TWF225_008164 [Orbilia oligospora]KAF3268875.1 hypothetical protein TWF217_010166 [Orbilia oligospora]